MQTILITGAAGDVGTRLRKLLKGAYPRIRMQRHTKAQATFAPTRTSLPPISPTIARSRRSPPAIDGIVHLGGYSVEGPWDTIHKSNIVGCYNLFEAAYRTGVKRVVFASSNHAVGFYPRERENRGRRNGPSRQSLWGQQGFRRGGRCALCRQARTARDVHTHRQRRTTVRSTSGDCRSGSSRKIS